MASKLWLCVAANCPALPLPPRNTMGTWNCPPLICNILAAWLMIWSLASTAKFQVMNSTMGRSPFMAAPTAMPVKPNSAIGVSITRFSPNSASMPLLTLYAPSYSATSSPRRKTFGSRRISSDIASFSASRNWMVRMWKGWWACGESNR